MHIKSYNTVKTTAPNSTKFYLCFFAQTCPLQRALILRNLNIWKAFLFLQFFQRTRNKYWLTWSF